MKILTNIQCASLEELARHNFVISWRDYLHKKHRETQLVAIDLFWALNHDLGGNEQVLFEDGNFKFVRKGIICRSLRDIIALSNDLSQFENELRPIIDAYRSAIFREKPDFVLINCTNCLPWCLYAAAKKEGVKKIAIHYHGILKKEIENYEKKPKDLLLKMELNFHGENDLVIFPSLLAKDTVEREVVVGKIKNWVIVPNAIPDYFFDVPQKTKGKGKNIGAVMRWSVVKNHEFLNKLARYGAENKKQYRINIVSEPFRRDNDLYREMKGLVNFIAPLSNADVCSFYSRMDAIVCPSHFETYGNVAQESLAAGTPALVGRNMGIAGLFRDLGLDDWVIDYNNFDIAAEKIENISFETVKQSLRDELYKRLNTEMIYDSLFGAMSSL